MSYCGFCRYSLYWFLLYMDIGLVLQMRRMYVGVWHPGTQQDHRLAELPSLSLSTKPHIVWRIGYWEVSKQWNILQLLISFCPHPDLEAFYIPSSYHVMGNLKPSKLIFSKQFDFLFHLAWCFLGVIPIVCRGMVSICSVGHYCQTWDQIQKYILYFKVFKYFLFKSWSICICIWAFQNEKYLYLYLNTWSIWYFKYNSNTFQIILIYFSWYFV